MTTTPRSPSRNLPLVTFVLAVLGLGLNAMCLVDVLLSPTDVVVQSTGPDELSRMDVLPAVLASKLAPGGLHLLAVGLCAMVAVGARRPERQSDRRLRTAFGHLTGVERR